MKSVLPIDKALDEITEGKVKETLDLLRSDREVSSLYEQANKLSILRLGYNDHGIVHAKIASYNALRILNILLTEGVVPNIVSEEVGNEEDSKVAVLLGAFLHDIGLCIARENHELLGAIISRPIVKRILEKIYGKVEKSFRMLPIVLEGITCHMGNYQATSLEAKIVEVADGTDISKGRARIPFHIGRLDIHKFSALAIEKIEILKGEKKPLRFEIFMENPAGIFQTEEILIKKIKDAKFEDKVEIVAIIGKEREVRYF
jgi:metal-dependent HD superfamily phosphatase/phosphodiesterase